MELSDLISPDSVLADLKPNSKKQLLQDLAEASGRAIGVEERRIFETLLQRERLGSTGIGNGVAIPHGKLPGLKGIFGIFARLAKPIDFDSMDEQPVDLVFLLLAPEGSGADHLKALSRIARVLREPNMLDRLRATSNKEALYSLLTEHRQSTAA